MTVSMAWDDATGENELADPAPADVERRVALIDGAVCTGVGLRRDDGSMLMITGSAWGLVVLAAVVGDSAAYVLASANGPHAQTMVPLGDDPVPANLVVARPEAVRAAVWFLRHGTRDPALPWIVDH